MKYYSHENPDMDVWLSFRRAHEAIHKVRKKDVRKYRISTAESAVLLIVNASDNKATPAEISRQLLKDAHSISQLLVRMKRKGLVKKLKDLPRRNMVRVALTDKGREAYGKSQEGDSIIKVMSVLTKDEKKQLVTLLDKLRFKALEVLR